MLSCQTASQQEIMNLFLAGRLQSKLRSDISEGLWHPQRCQKAFDKSGLVGRSVFYLDAKTKAVREDDKKAAQQASYHRLQSGGVTAMASPRKRCRCGRDCAAAQNRDRWLQLQLCLPEFCFPFFFGTGSAGWLVVAGANVLRCVSHRFAIFRRQGIRMRRSKVGLSCTGTWLLSSQDIQRSEKSACQLCIGNR